MKFKTFIKETTNKIDESMGDNFEPGDAVPALKLEAGKMYFAFYRNGGHTHMELFKFTGVSDAEQKYGESGPKFKTVKDAMTHYNLRNMKEVSAMDSKENGREYGQSIRLCGEWEGGDKGCYYYPSGSSWTRGSGADRLKFYKAVPRTND